MAVSTTGLIGNIYQVIYFSYTKSSTILSSTSAVYLRPPMTIPVRPNKKMQLTVAKIWMWVKYWQYNREDYRRTKKICIVPLLGLFAAMPPVRVERHWLSQNLCVPTPRVRLSARTGFVAIDLASFTISSVPVAVLICAWNVSCTFLFITANVINGSVLNS